jgi:hypothetical protein
MKDDKIDRTCSTYWGMRNEHKILVKNTLKKRENLGELDVDSTIILKLILWKQSVTV